MCPRRPDFDSIFYRIQVYFSTNTFVVTPPFFHFCLYLLFNYLEGGHSGASFIHISWHQQDLRAGHWMPTCVGLLSSEERWWIRGGKQNVSGHWNYCSQTQERDDMWSIWWFGVRWTASNNLESRSTALSWAHPCLYSINLFPHLSSLLWWDGGYTASQSVFSTLLSY